MVPLSSLNGPVEGLAKRRQTRRYSDFARRFWFSTQGEESSGKIHSIWISLEVLFWTWEYILFLSLP